MAIFIFYIIIMQNDVSGERVKHEIFIELFRFNAQTDYLPYYQKYTLQYSENDSFNDLLNQMNEIEAFGFDENCNLKVNDLYINANELVHRLVSKTGHEIRIDPISEFRAKKDLQIDRSDFIDKLSVLQSYLEAGENIEYRKSTELAYYASNTLNYKRDFIGDHVLLIAADLIEKDFSLRNEVIELLISKENGIWFHTSLENRLLDTKVEEKIQRLIYLCTEYIKPKSKMAKTLVKLFSEEEKTGFEENLLKVPRLEISQFFTDFNIASYDGVQESRLEDLINDAQASYIQIPSRNEDLASNSAFVDENFSFKIGGDILMQAKDNNADFMLVKNEKTKEFFDKNQERMEKLTGRELGLSVVSQEQFVQLLQGEKDSAKLGFDTHKVKVSFFN